MHHVLRNTRIEYHILQSFPVTCLNRDDVGAPKSAIVGGIKRARVSSQCWKRQVRLTLADLGVKLAVRTKKVAELVANACLQREANEEQAQQCGMKIAELLAADTLLFLSQHEAFALAEYAREQAFDIVRLKDKELTKQLKKVVNPALDGLDIALFGRMVAKAVEMQVEAAASFNHAISTHPVSNEVEFFTAIDDLQQNQLGAAHMGCLEYNSATYYRYVNLDLGQLARNLGYAQLSASSEQLQQAIAVFTKALFLAVPAARQTTQAGACPWDFARVLVRRGQGLQASFEKPVNKAIQGGYLQPSIEELKKYLDI